MICVKCKQEKELFQFNLCYECISEIRKYNPFFKFLLNEQYGLFAENDKLKFGFHTFKLIGYSNGKPIFS